MQRIPQHERPDWFAQAECLGFRFHTIDGQPYWDERAAYRFSLKQIEADLEAPTEEIHAMSLALVEEIAASEELLDRLRVPEHFREPLAASWSRREPHLYGRLDLAYDGRGPAKLFELNYDTPTALYEAAFFQWLWLEQQQQNGELPAAADQFNSIQECLMERFAGISVQQPLYFACAGDSPEDRGTVDYLRDIATQAGHETRHIDIETIGLDRLGGFVDLEDQHIPTLFKLYPWEFMLEEDFGQHIGRSFTRFIEPPWKALLSNKGILALLWERHPGHPNLLPAYFEDAPGASLPPGWVRKPLLSREGANVQLHTLDGQRLAVPGPYDGPAIRQACHPLPCFDGHYPVIGSWVVGDRACGIGIREDATLVTQDSSRFLPHFILD